MPFFGAMNTFFHHYCCQIGMLHLRFRYEGDICLALVDIPDIIDTASDSASLPLEWLSEEEKHYLQRFRFPKRHNEWLCGRMAAKCCLLMAPKDSLLSYKARDITILPDEHGRPVVSTHLEHPKNISISHSHRFAVAMAAQTPCGLDIQHITTQILKVQDRLAGEEEIAFVRQQVSGTMQTCLTLIWCVKEAVKKHRLPDQAGLFEVITIEDIKEQETNLSWTVHCRLRNFSQRQTVHVICRDQYMLAWSWE